MSVSDIVNAKSMSSGEFYDKKVADLDILPKNVDILLFRTDTSVVVDGQKFKSINSDKERIENMQRTLKKLNLYLSETPQRKRQRSVSL